MWQILKYGKQIIAITFAVPDLIRAAENLECKIREAKQDNDITAVEALDIVEAGLGSIINVLGQIKVTFL